MAELSRIRKQDVSGVGPQTSWRRRSTTLRVGAALVGASLLLAACGASDDEESDDSGQSDDPAAVDEPEDNADGGEGGGELPADYESVILQNAHHNAPTTWLARSDQEWADEIAERSDGKIQIEFNWSSALAGPADSIEALGSGIAQIGLAFPVFAPGGFEVDAWISDLSFLSSPHPVIGDMQAWAASVEWGLNTPAKIEEFRNQGVEPLLPHIETNANYFLVCTEPVTSLADAQGKTVRVAGSAWTKEAEAIGMAPAQMPAGDMFEALQRGVIDCSLNPFRDMVDFGLLEAANQVTFDPEVSFSGFNFALAANKEWWDSQPLEARQLIWSSLRNYTERQLEAAVEQDFVLIEGADELGTEIHAMEADLREALVANQQERREAAVANAPAAVADDAEEIVAAWEETMDRWFDIIHDELGYGEQIPPTWDEFVEAGMTIEDIDFGPWADRVWEDVLEPQMPS